MALNVLPLQLTRNVLAEITKNNPEAIKQLENLFAVVNDTASLDILNIAIVGENAFALANLTFGLLKQVEQQAALSALAPAPILPNLIRPGRAGYAGDGTTTAFALPGIWSASNDPEDFDVSIDGIAQDTTAYTVLAGTITFSNPPPYCPPTYSSIIVRSRR